MSRIIETERKTRTAKNRHDLPLYRVLWCRIRYYQQLHEISDEALANELGVHVRTLSTYDKNAENVTFGRLDNFLYMNRLTLNDLLNS